MTTKIDFTGKNVLITGANGSIGHEITLQYLNSGASCICLDKNFQNLKKLKSKNSFSKRLTFLNLDFENKDFKKILYKKIFNIKKIDVLINNAGFTSSKEFLKYNLDDWEKTIRINLTCPFIISQMISKNCMKNGGSIINITSLAAEQGFPENVAYVASKGGLKQLTKAMAIDLAKKKIRVN